MKVISYLFLLPLIILSSFLLGVHYGSTTGIEHHYHLDNVISANIDVLRAKDLKGGSDEQLKHIYWEYELSINRGIDSYIWYQNSGSQVFSKLFFPKYLEHLDDAIEHLSTYRSANPVEAIDCDTLGLKPAEQQCLENLAARRRIVLEHSGKPNS